MHLLTFSLRLLLQLYLVGLEQKSGDYVDANINNTATATFSDNYNFRHGIRDF